MGIAAKWVVTTTGCSRVCRLAAVAAHLVLEGTVAMHVQWLHSLKKYTWLEGNLLLTVSFKFIGWMQCRLHHPKTQHSSLLTCSVCCVPSTECRTSSPVPGPPGCSAAQALPICSWA